MNDKYYNSITWDCALPIAMRACAEFHYSPLTSSVVGSVPFGGTAHGTGLMQRMMDSTLHWI